MESMTEARPCCVKSLISDAAMDLAFKGVVELMPSWSFEPITMIRLAEISQKSRPQQDRSVGEEFLAVDEVAVSSPTLRRVLDPFESRVIWVRRQVDSIQGNMPTERRGWFQLNVEKPISEIVAELDSWARKKVERFPKPPEILSGPTQHLTRREVEILDRLSKGERYCDISDSLGVSIDTVRGHLRRLYPKLGVHCRTAAVAVYLETRTLVHGTTIS